MDHGKVIATGSKEELLSILSSEDTIQVQLSKRSEAFIDKFKSIPAVLQVDETNDGLRILAKKNHNLLSELVHAAEKEGIQIVNYRVEIPSLEDVFLHLTGKTLRD
jgi:ABC-2 type transport system ATP-binding protein